MVRVFFSSGPTTMKSRRTSVAIFTCAALLVMPPLVWAVKPAPPRSYVKPVGQEFLFVMRTADEDLTRFNEEAAAPQREIHKKYKASGLYRVDNASNPLWTIDWFAWPEDLMVLEDGVHLVWFKSGYLRLISGTPSPVARADLLQATGVEVYANGESVWKRRVEELVPYPRLLTRDGWYRSIVPNTGAGTIVVATGDGCTTTLGLRTGEILLQTRPAESWLQNYASRLVIVGVGIIGGVLLIRRVTRRRTRVPPTDSATR
jgi:hypothetical protein